MDSRKRLECGQVLSFPGIECHISEVIGAGSNAIVYKGWYEDSLHRFEKHYILIKELFPLHPKGLILRDNDQKIRAMDEESEAFFRIHRESFEAGNKIHLRLLQDAPDSLGSNLNTYNKNGTLYTILGYSGSSSLDEMLSLGAYGHDLHSYTKLMLGLMDAIEAFHDSGYLHLDISPDNILILGKADNMRAMLIDYNSARKMDDGEIAYLSCKTGYSAPEVEMGDAEEIGEASDLYSAAAVFFRCLMGRPLNLEELIQSTPPDAHESACLQDAPQTVCWQVRRILRNGLCSIPEDRYQSVAEMRTAFKELEKRIDCVGVTHWALWETGRRQIEEMIRVNPALRFIQNEAELYPIRLEMDGQRMTLNGFLEETLSESGSSTLVVSQGGMGKTTMLMKTVLMQNMHYAENRAAAFYVSLSGRHSDDPLYIRSKILSHLRFSHGTVTFQSALHELELLLNKPLWVAGRETPSVLIVLDGLNEAQGDIRSLIEEIRLLDSLQGVRILAVSRSQPTGLALKTCRLLSLQVEDIQRAAAPRGILLPRNEELLHLMKTPLILNIYLKASEKRQQLYITDQNGLIQAYLDSLKQKALEHLPEKAPERWQINAALHFVLPAIAAKAGGTGRALTNEEMLRVIEKCYRVHTSSILHQAFSDWTGHSKDILGGAKNAEEWYGIIVHDILWQQLGLLVKNDQNSYRVFHQVIEEHLIPYHQQNLKKIMARRLLQRSLMAIPVLLVLVVAFGIYASHFMVTPYDDSDAEYVLSQSQRTYNEYVRLFEEIEELFTIVQGGEELYALQASGFKPVGLVSTTLRKQKLIALMETRDLTAFEKQYITVLSRISAMQSNADTLDRLKELSSQERKVVSWSKLPLDIDSLMELNSFVQEKAAYYDKVFLPEFKRWYYAMDIGDSPKALQQEGSSERSYFMMAWEMLDLDAQACDLLYSLSIEEHTQEGPLFDLAVESAHIRNQNTAEHLRASINARGEWNNQTLTLIKMDSAERKGGCQALVSLIKEDQTHDVLSLAYLQKSRLQREQAHKAEAGSLQLPADLEDIKGQYEEFRKSHPELSEEDLQQILLEEEILRELEEEMAAVSEQISTAIASSTITLA